MKIEEAIRKYRLAGVLGNESVQIVETDSEPLVIFSRTALPMRHFETLMMYATLKCNPAGESYERIANKVGGFWKKYDCTPEKVNLQEEARYCGHQIFTWFKSEIESLDAPKEVQQYYNDRREVAFWSYIDKRNERDVKGS